MRGNFWLAANQLASQEGIYTMEWVSKCVYWSIEEQKLFYNPLNAELNPIGHLLALLGAHHILHVSRIRVKVIEDGKTNLKSLCVERSKVKGNKGTLRKFRKKKHLLPLAGFNPRTFQPLAYWLYRLRGLRLFFLQGGVVYYYFTQIQKYVVIHCYTGQLFEGRRPPSMVLRTQIPDFPPLHIITSSP